MKKNLTGILAFLFLIGTLVDGGGPPTWDPQVQSQIVLTQPGVGSVYLKWPSANNNLYQMLGYQLYVGLMSDPTSGVVVLDGRGFPDVREFIQTGLTPGQQYNFSLVAWNQDPVTLNNYSSSRTTRQVNVNLLKTEDPTNLKSVVTAAVATGLTSGVYSRIAFQGIHPDSGLDMRIGSVCLPADDATCVPGRNYVVSFRPICVLDSTSTECIDPRENSRAQFLMGRPTRNWLNDYPSPNQYIVPAPVSSGDRLDLYPGINEANLGFYTLDFAPPVAGTYSMLVESIVPGKITVMYWENEKFFGSPSNIDNQPLIDFDWEYSTIVQFTSDAVSVRVVAYLQPISDGTFELKCTSDTFCDVWIDDVAVLETIKAGTRTCSTGCVIPRQFTFRRSQLYSVRVEYVTGIGESFLQLAWKDVGSTGSVFHPIPSTVWVSRAFASNIPYVVSVESGRLSGKYSTIELDDENFISQGFGSALVNRPVTVYIRVKDETNSPCTSSDPWASVYITVEPVDVDQSSPGNLIRIIGQYLSDGSNAECVYTSTVLYPVPGKYQIRGFVNDEMVSNSPLVTVATLNATQISVINSVFESVLPAGGPLETSTSFSIRFRLVNEDGFDIPSVSPDWGAQVSGMFQRRTDFITSPECGTRIEYNWLINCFPQTDGTYAFTYTDDSMLDVSNFPNLATTTWQLSSSNGQSFLTVYSMTTKFAGYFEFSVWFNGELVSGSSVDVTVIPKQSNPVNPAMSVVMLLLPDSGTSEIFEDNEILLRVLLRDQFGNPLTDRASESVELILTPGSPGPGPSVFTCSYVTGQYYDCVGRPSFLGQTAITVTVNSISASVISGGPPEGSACKTATTCGFSDCLCNQFREPFSLSLNVLGSD